MKTIEIEDDLYEHLRRNTVVLGESATEVIWRLIRINGKKQKASLLVPIEECLNSNAFSFKTKAVDKFLYILSWLYSQNPDQFKCVLKITGRSRIYFSQSREELEKSGRSVNPAKIPESPYWVITNTSTAEKKDILMKVMVALGYRGEDFGKARRTFN